jgi:hypothetical protein
VVYCLWLPGTRSKYSPTEEKSSIVSPGRCIQLGRRQLVVMLLVMHLEWPPFRIHLDRPAEWICGFWARVPCRQLCIAVSSWRLGYQSDVLDLGVVPRLVGWVRT